MFDEEKDETDKYGPEFPYPSSRDSTGWNPRIQGNRKARREYYRRFDPTYKSDGRRFATEKDLEYADEMGDERVLWLQEYLIQHFGFKGTSIN